MRGIFERLFAPSMEPTHDPRVLEMAARESERRIVRQEIERAGRMAEYAEKWPGLQAEAAAPAERAPVLVWTREAAL
jgi:hypothetical protein